MNASIVSPPLACVLAAALLSGCAGLASDRSALHTASATPQAWFAPLPHGGKTADLAVWWQQFNDPVLSEFIVAAQTVSSSVAQAASRIEQSRAAQVAASSALLPLLDAQASGSRGRQAVGVPVTTTGSLGLQTRWELDVFGAGRATRTAADQRLAGAQASWHDARVSVAAEAANRYIGLRSCLAQVRTAAADALSRAETARLTELSAKAGFQAPASSALARASSAQGASLLNSQQARCDLDIKALVALTALDELALRQRLERQRLAVGDTAWFAVPQPTQLHITQVPGQVLAQRPDVAASEREWLARQADVAQQQAQRLPQISLSGHISAARSSVGGFSSDGTVWSLGPLQVTLPLFDGGTRRANVEAAQASLIEAGVSYRSAVRTAVREVEESLINLQSTFERETHAVTAGQGFTDSFKATAARYRSGLASLFELEDARRTAVQAQSALIDLQRERSTAWVSLYRALGGGWSAANVAADTAAAPVAPLAR
jgi:outer membrane protein, multidrug efflux system